jgi:hypothetical protein
MTTGESHPGSTGRWPRSPRWLRRIAIGLLLVELAYIVVFEWAARSGRLEHWINRRPEKFVLAFASAHSFFPFHVTATGLELQGQTPRVRWRARAEEATGWISPLPLFRRTLRIPSVEASGGEFWLRHEAKVLGLVAARASESEREGLLPPLPPLQPRADPRPPSTRPKWSFELPQIEASGYRDVWLDGLRLGGEFAARGGFSMFSGREVEVAPSRVEWNAVRAAIGETEIGRVLGGAAEISVERYSYKERRGRAALQYISGTAEVRGELADGELLGLFLRRAPWLSFGTSLGELDARLRVTKGDLEAGSRVEFRHPRLETKLFDFQAVGDARIHFEVQAPAAGDSQERAILTVLYEDFAVRSGAETEPLFLGTGLSLVATTSKLELGSVLDSTRMKIDVGTARIPDFTTFNSWLPASSGLSVLGGAGALTGTLDADLATNRATGDFHASIEGAALRFRDLDLAGVVKVDLHIPDADLDRRTFELAGSRVELSDFHCPQAEAAGPSVASSGWWARVALDEGRLTLPPTPSAHGRFQVELRDSVPLVGLFETRKNLPSWVARLLTVENIRAGGTFAWSRSETLLDHLATQFRGANIQGRIRFGRASRQGQLMVEWRRLALGLQIENARKNWKFIGVRDWYANSELGSPFEASAGDDPLSEAALGQAELGGAMDLSSVELPATDFAYEVVPGSPVTGELDGDAGLEAVAVIALPSVAAPRSLRLAAADLVDGRAVAIASLELAPSTVVLSLTIEGETVVARLQVPGPAGAIDTPAVEKTVRWQPRGEGPARAVPPGDEP